MTDYEQACKGSNTDSDTEDNITIENDGLQESDDETRGEDDQEEAEDNRKRSDNDDGERRRAQRRQERRKTNNAREQPTRNNQIASQSAVSTITIRNVEDSISYFLRNDQMKVERWIDEFEDMNELLQWNDLQKVIYAKKLLCGSAKQYMVITERDNHMEINEETYIERIPDEI